MAPTVRRGLGSCHRKSRFMVDELGPTLHSRTLRRVEGLPVGPGWPLPQPHAGHFRGPVGLAGVARNAGGDTVGPVRWASARPWNDVVDGDRLAAWLRSAVLAGVVVALGDVPPAERDGRAG